MVALVSIGEIQAIADWIEKFQQIDRTWKINPSFTMVVSINLFSSCMCQKVQHLVKAPVLLSDDFVLKMLKFIIVPLRRKNV